jgi:hypothetical protein
MNITFSLENREGYLLVIISGVYSKGDDFLSIPDAILKECQLSGKNKALLNIMNLSLYGFTDMDRFYLGARIAETLRGKVKLSAACKIENTSRFAETVAKNRGAQFAVFTDFNQAEEWLVK